MVAVHALEAKKGEKIQVIHLGPSAYTDDIIIATGTSETHVKTLADNVEDCLQRSGTVVDGIEGTPTNHWILVDCGEFVVHIFLAEVRELYNLEKLWGHDVHKNEDNEQIAEA